MFRFTIRDVLWLTVVVGLAIGLAKYQHAAALWQRRAQAAVNAITVDGNTRAEWQSDRIQIIQNTGAIFHGGEVKSYRRFSSAGQVD